MKTTLSDLIRDALSRLQDAGTLPAGELPPVTVERSRGGDHGDFASPVALSLAKSARTNPRQLAAALVDELPVTELIERVDIAGPGFINFFLTDRAFQALVPQILSQGDRFGRSEYGRGTKVQVEFVSANPTGPLHVGHGRGAAYGDTVANLLAAVGHEVQREYYVNDAGRQMDILAISVWLRYLEACGEVLRFPDNGYQGDYIRDEARSLLQAQGETLKRPAADLMGDLPPDESEGGDKEQHVDALIACAKKLLGNSDYQVMFSLIRESQVAEIRDDLQGFGVEFDCWYSESKLKNGPIVAAVEKLETSGEAYRQGGALWFKATDYGDEKDRVVVRENGEPTYFASDIAYHQDKFGRGFDRVIDVWGSDHHGYVPRVKGALQALGLDQDRFEVLIVQFANLFRGGEKMPMSTRSGQFVTLRELREDVGVDAARYFYVMRRSEQHLDFDLDLAKSKSNDNPVYYIQYAHARICSVARQAEERGQALVVSTLGEQHWERLSEDRELQLLKTLSRYPEVVESAAVACEPHQMAFYLRDLANELHGYYNAHQFLVEDAILRDARLALVSATGQVLRSGLALLGVSAPESM